MSRLFNYGLIKRAVCHLSICLVPFRNPDLFLKPFETTKLDYILLRRRIQNKNKCGSKTTHDQISRTLEFLLLSVRHELEVGRVDEHVPRHLVCMAILRILKGICTEIADSKSTWQQFWQKLFTVCVKHMSPDRQTRDGKRMAFTEILKNKKGKWKHNINIIQTFENRLRRLSSIDLWAWIPWCSSSTAWPSPQKCPAGVHSLRHRWRENYSGTHCTTSPQRIELRPWPSIPSWKSKLISTS